MSFTSSVTPMDNRETFRKFKELASKYVDLGQNNQEMVGCLSTILVSTKVHPPTVFLQSSTNVEAKYSFINRIPSFPSIVSPIILQPLDVHDFTPLCLNHYKPEHCILHNCSSITMFALSVHSWRYLLLQRGV